MENYKSFMIAERQNRINKNKFKMNKLRFEINSLKENYRDNLNEIANLTKQYTATKEQIQTLEQDYDRLKDKSVLYHKSDKIQMLSETLVNKEENIKFTEGIRDWYYDKKNILLFISSFKKFYKYKKQISYEETNENLSLIEIIKEYFKQCRIFKKAEKKIQSAENPILELLIKYDFEKRYIMEEIQVLTFELEERRNLIWNFPDKKKQLEDRLEEILVEIKQIIDSNNYVTYTQKVGTYSQLNEENKNYQAQIKNIMEISETEPSKTLRKCV